MRKLIQLSVVSFVVFNFNSALGDEFETQFEADEITDTDQAKEGEPTRYLIMSKNAPDVLLSKRTKIMYVKFEFGNDKVMPVTYVFRLLNNGWWDWLDLPAGSDKLRYDKTAPEKKVIFESPKGTVVCAQTKAGSKKYKETKQCEFSYEMELTKLGYVMHFYVTVK